jgi:hypothetical protein
MEKRAVGLLSLTNKKSKWCCEGMSKLQKEIAYKHNDHAYYRYRLSVPPDVVESAGWDEGTELVFRTKKT